ncbi:hypothetical protein ACFLQ6_01780, partial [Thermoproteota archaeon]
RIYQKVYKRGPSGGWQNWKEIIQKFNSAPAAVNSPDGKVLDLFALGEDNQIYQIVYYRGGNYSRWGTWVNIKGKTFKSAPGVVNSPDGKVLDLFALGEDNRIYQIVYTRGKITFSWPSSFITYAQYGDWQQVPGNETFNSAPAAVNSPDGNVLNLFALGQNNRIYQKVYKRGPSGGWQNWQQVPGNETFNSAPAAVNSPDGNVLNLFALGQNNRIYQKVYKRGPSGGWQNWQQVPGNETFNSAPAAVNSPDGNVLNLFALGQNNRIYQKVYKRGPSGGWQNWKEIDKVAPLCA